MANVNSVISLMAEVASSRLAADWDNVGLQVGNFEQEVNRVLLTLDINEEIVDEALNKECGMVISHHPLIFKGIQSIHNRTETGRIIIKSIKNDLVLFSAHTNLDIATGGLNDYLVDLIGIKNTSPLDVTDKEEYYKLAVFIPEGHLQEVKEAMFAKGAGYIGNYSHTSFVTDGEGTFKPLVGSQPYCGKIDELSEVEEKRFETIVPATKISNVIKAMLKVHPYEEVAYDIYPLLNDGEKYGLGRIGYLKEETTLDDFLELLQDKLDIKHLKYVESSDYTINKVAVCSGSGADYISRAAQMGTDLYLTADVKYHEAQRAEEMGMMLVDIGHYESEIIVKNLLKSVLSEKAAKNNYQLEFIKSEKNTNPWQKI